MSKPLYSYQKLIGSFRLVVIIVFTLIFQQPALAQQSAPQKKDQSIKSKRKLRQEDKRKWKEARRTKRAEEKKIRDHHKRIQTKEVRKRMKRNKQKAIRNNNHQREPFLQRIFQKKRSKGSKHPKEKTTKVQQ